MRLPHLPFLAAALASVLGAGCGGGSTPSGGGPGGGPPPPPPPPPPPQSGWSAQATLGSPCNDFTCDIVGIDVDLNDSGTGIAAWEEKGDSSGSVWVAWYRSGAWGAATRLSDPAVAAILPRVALDGAGDAILAYEVVDYDATGWPRSRTIWARRWAGGAWTAAERLCGAPPAPGQLYAMRPRVGIDGQGRALVTWDEVDESLPQPSNIRAARFDGVAWSAPFLVSSGDRYAAWADAAVSTDGSAAVVWSQDTNPYDPGQSGGGPTIPNIWARVFDGSSWGPPSRIGSADLADFEGCERAQVVMDGFGRAFAIWEEGRLSENRIVAASLAPPGPSWSAPALLAGSSDPVVNLSFPSIATGGNGDAFAVWQASVPGESVAHGAAARCGAGGWDPATTFEDGGDVRYAVAAMDGAASGWALHSLSGMRARRHDPALGWQDSTPIGPGYVTDAKANGAGTIIIGGYDAYYSSSPLGFFLAARAAVYLP
jgi:hypothetical protein